MDILCVLHDQDEYGICRWPLKELAQVAGVSLALARELASKDVLKGADADCPAFMHQPSHAGRLGEPVVLIEPTTGPCWYSSRLVRDEWVRGRRGVGTRFGDEPSRSPSRQPSRSPIHRVGDDLGEGLGDGPSSSSSSSDSTPLPPASGGRVGRPDEKAPHARQARKAGAGVLPAAPATPEGLALHALFRRRPDTQWSAPEIRAFKDARPTMQEIQLVAAYTNAERAAGKEGRHRRDLGTLLNNWHGEVDRAQLWAESAARGPARLAPADSIEAFAAWAKQHHPERTLDISGGWDPIPTALKREFREWRAAQ